MPVADIPVGEATSHGLSGGQKRRLCVAVHLLSLPSLIFLDEPTTGLDAASSLELVKYLCKVASSNRTVVMTIHQPRLEIYHMFHKVLLLSKGQVRSGERIIYLAQILTLYRIINLMSKHYNIVDKDINKFFLNSGCLFWKSHQGVRVHDGFLQQMLPSRNVEL